jgi:IS30 family transposase
MEISILLKKGYSRRDIGQVLGKSHSSVGREIVKHSTGGKYDPVKAAHKAYVKRLYSKYEGMKVATCPELEKYVRSGMKKFWTPEQIAGRWKQEKHRDKQGKIIIISAPSIYKYLYSNRGQPLCRYLSSRRYQPKKRRGPKKLKRQNIPYRVSIELRPDIASRKEFGHFEADTLGRIRSDTAVVTGSLERKSRFILLKKVHRLKDSMAGFKKILNPYHNIIKSVTLDNGVENVRHRELKVSTYFTHPYSSWEKGSIENSFLRLRRFIPKKSSLRNYSAKALKDLEKIMNNTPRKCLDFRTPREVFTAELRASLDTS